MNAAQLLSISALTVFAAFSAHADDGDNSQHGYNFKSTRTVAEVKAEALNPIRVTEASVGPVETLMSMAQRADVRAQAIAALRAGQISAGEIGLM